MKDDKYEGPKILGVYATGFREIHFKNINISGMEPGQCDVCNVCSDCAQCDIC